VQPCPATPPELRRALSVCGEAIMRECRLGTTARQKLGHGDGSSYPRADTGQLVRLGHHARWQAEDDVRRLAGRPRRKAKRRAHAICGFASCQRSASLGCPTSRRRSLRRSSTTFSRPGWVHAEWPTAAPCCARCCNRQCANS
jgi:hypothetical protein